MVREPLRVGSTGVPVGIAPGEVDRQRRTMIDQPRPAAPGEEVRVPRRAVRIRQEAVEPDDTGCPLRVRGVHGGVEGHGPGQEVEPDVPADACDEQVMDLLVRLAVGDRLHEVDGDKVRDLQAELAADLAGDPFRDQHARPLAGAPELDDVHPVVVRLDEAWQRAPLPAGRHVSGGPNLPHGPFGRCRHRAASPTDSIAAAARATPSRARISAPRPAIRVRSITSPSRRSIAAARSASANAYVGSRTPKPVSSTRWALSYWSQNRGSTIIGLPKWNASVVVLLPPWVTTRSTSGTIEVCGRNSEPHMFGARS